MAKAAVTACNPQVTSGQFVELHQQIGSGTITRRMMTAFLNHQNPFEIPTNPLDQWTQFYSDVLGLEVDFSDVKVPENPGGFDQIIYMAQGLSYDQVEEACKNADKFWKYSDQPLSELVAMDQEARTTAMPYAICVRGSEEADAVHQSKSADDLDQTNIKGQTLLERLVHGLFYYRMNNRHLDFRNWTLCAGSRFCDGNVPGVYFYPGKPSVDVGCCRPRFRCSSLRVREVVTV